jgi:hypothetical protein
MKEISDALGNPAKAPTDPTRNWRQMNDLRRHVQAWLTDRGRRGVALSPTPAYDRRLNNPTRPTDGSQALSNETPLTPEQAMENWRAISEGRNPPHAVPSGRSGGATAGNLFEAITTKFKVDGLADPENPEAKPPVEEVSRDPRLYVSAVNQLAAVKHYYEIREKAVTRRKDLQQLLSDILIGIRDAKDFAHLGKLTALANLIEGQLKMCNDDIHGAFNDVAVRGVQMFAISQMKQTAEMEKQQYEMNRKLSQVTEMTDKLDELEDSTPGTGSPTTGFGTGVSATGFLPWHR